MSGKESRTVEVTRTFQLLQRLGEGAMGEVHEAYDSVLGQRLAIKVLHADLDSDQDLRNRFAAEAKIMASIDHPGNLPIYGLGVDAQGRPFYAMKAVAGRTLEEILAERGDRASDITWLRRLFDLYEAVCDTVACAHESGIIHRDLKPANILVDEKSGSVYVVDWGLAKRVAITATEAGVSPTLDGIVMGTPGYLSPEQASGDSAMAGPQADVFALGVILYQILTAKQPFAGDSTRESMLSAIHHRPRNPRRFNFWVSRSIAAVCQKALVKDPSRRYRSARPLADDVRAYRRGRRVSVTRPSLLERARGRALRRPGTAALALAAITALMIGALFVGGQIWADQALVEKAFDSIAVIDADIADYNREIRALTREPDSEARRQELATRTLAKELEATNLLISVARLRFISASDQFLALGRERVFRTIESLLRNGEPALAKAMAATAVERIVTGVSAVELTPADFDRLQILIDEADSAIASAAEAAETERDTEGNTQ